VVGHSTERLEEVQSMKSGRIMLLAWMMVGVALSVTFRSQEVLAQGKDDPAAKIVGTWELTKSGGDLPPGTTIEFTKEGKLKAVLKADDQVITIEGTYKVEKNKIHVKVKIGEETVEETVTIKRLTDKELEVEDKEGKVDTFKKK
jgi:uncharacterized protein (TIGR03066 family)